MKPTPSKLSEHLWLRRMPSSELAKRTGYSLATIKAWRCGLRAPSRGARMILAKTLGLTPAQVAEFFVTKGDD